MSQQLVSSRFPYLPIRLQIRQATYEEEALIDTGFDGGMALPPFLLEGQEPDLYQRWTLAEGSQIVAPVYRGMVQLGEFQPVSVLVIAMGEECLIGLDIVNRFSVLFDHGARIVVNL
ncbi:MAG: hypothetical protein IIC99_12205 [Chloroflexi bacterium]|nr:hypothetical protein [Chloroflexota bacterium]